MLKGTPLKLLMLLGALFLAAGIGLLDWKIGGTEVSFSIFYLAPIGLAAWHLNLSAGLLVALLSLLMRGWIDFSRLHLYSHAWIPLDNMAIRSAFFLCTVLALARIRMLMERERRFGTLDYVTGIPNRRAFMEHADREVSRCRRYGQPFTIAFLDCDDFKLVNDRWGHRVGDELLRLIGVTLRDQVRNSDFVARLGGDEFVILLPDSDNELAAEVLTRVHDALLKAMEGRSCLVTFSIGGATYRQPLESVEEMLARADEMMYSTKKEGKNRIMVRVVQNGTDFSPAPES